MHKTILTRSVESRRNGVEESVLRSEQTFASRHLRADDAVTSDNAWRLWRLATATGWQRRRRATQSDASSNSLATRRLLSQRAVCSTSAAVALIFTTQSQCHSVANFLSKSILSLPYFLSPRALSRTYMWRSDASLVAVVTGGRRATGRPTR